MISVLLVRSCYFMPPRPPVSLGELRPGVAEQELMLPREHGASQPRLLSQAYPSQKPLASWTRDLAVRVEQFELWASRAHPPVIFWLSGFTFPTGFLTAVLQASARQNNVSAQDGRTGEPGRVGGWRPPSLSLPPTDLSGQPLLGVHSLHRR